MNTEQINASYKDVASLMAQTGAHKARMLLQLIMGQHFKASSQDDISYINTKLRCGFVKLVSLSKRVDVASSHCH